MSDQTNTSYEFGAFRLIPSERQLLRDSQSVTLPPKALETLLMLVQNNGHAVKKEDLIRKVWPDAFVEESNLNHYVSILRKALSDGTKGQRYIETVPKYGYRFAADVRELRDETSALLVHKHTRTHVVFKEEQSESLKTVSSAQTAVGRNTTGVLRRAAILAFAVLIVAGMAAAYFGFIRSAHSRSASSASSVGTTRSKSENPAARAAYLKGRAFWERRTPEDMREAVKLFHEAITIDPNYAPAYAGLADAYLVGGSPPDPAESFTAVVRKALSLDDTLAEAHIALAYYLSAVDWNW